MNSEPSRNTRMLIELRDHPEGLTKELQGRKVTAAALYRKLIECRGKGFRYEDISEALADKWGSNNKKNNIVQAALKYAERLGLSLNERVGEKFQGGEHPLSALTGAWIMVTLRGRRDDPSVQVPPADYRTAILVYRDEVADKKRFEIIGQKTFWKGEAKLMSQQIYYWAEEIKRTHAKEALAMIMFGVNADSDIVDHHGASLSAAHGEFDGPDYPILASRISLYRSASLSKRLQASLDEEIKAKIARQWCAYFTEEQFEQMKSQKGGIAREIYLAIESFRQHGRNRNNRGHRIFLRS